MRNRIFSKNDPMRFSLKLGIKFIIRYYNLDFYSRKKNNSISPRLPPFRIGDSNNKFKNPSGINATPHELTSSIGSVPTQYSNPTHTQSKLYLRRSFIIIRCKLQSWWKYILSNVLSIIYIHRDMHIYMNWMCFIHFDNKMSILKLT